MEICHAFEQSNLHTVGPLGGFVDIVASNERKRIPIAGDGPVDIQSLNLFLKSSQCLHTIFCSVPIVSKQPHCSLGLLTRFKLKVHCMSTRRIQLG